MKKIKKKIRRISKYYYLDNLCNLAIVSVTIFCILLSVIYGFPWLQSFFSNISIVFQVLMIFGLSFIPTGSILVLLNKEPKTNKTEVNLYDKEMNRDERLITIKEKTGLFILTGESGCGKSCLLQSLFKNGEESCFYKDKDYSLPWNEQDYVGKRYVILDQFENALLDFDDEKKKMITGAAANNCLVVLSLKKEVYGDVCKIFSDMIDNDMFSGRGNVFWLSFDEKESVSLINDMNVSFGKERNNILYNDIVTGLERNRITYIQFSFLLSAVKNFKAKDANKKYLSYNCNFDLLIADYLKSEIEKFEGSQLACQILYLLSLDTKGLYTTGLSDFRNITLESQQEIESALQLLTEYKMISMHHFVGEYGHPDLDQYEISHEYISEIAAIICSERIDANIRRNIEYYHSNIQVKRKDQPSEVFQSTNMVCEDFSGNTISVAKEDKKIFSVTFIDKALILMLTIIIVLNIALINYYSIIPGDGSFLHVLDGFPSIKPFGDGMRSYVVLAMIDMMVGLSIFYMYNYYKQFLRIFSYKPLLVEKKVAVDETKIHESKIFMIPIIVVMFIGCIGCIAAYIFPKYWAIGLGMEFVSNGFLAFLIKRITRESEKEFFSLLSRSVCVSGIVVIAFGIVFSLYGERSFGIAMLLFFLYAMFMVFCITRHINRTNILSLVGRIVFNNTVYQKKNR